MMDACFEDAALWLAEKISMWAFQNIEDTVFWLAETMSRVFYVIHFPLVLKNKAVKQLYDFIGCE